MSDEKDAEKVGREIRRLLLSLYAPGHTAEDECAGRMNYGTDHLRELALDHAGICYSARGEMAPGCGCPWSPDKPDGPRLRAEENAEEVRRLWADECITREHMKYQTCTRGTKSCVVTHRSAAPKER